MAENSPRPRAALLRARAGYVGLAFATIAAGLLVHGRVLPLGSVSRDVLGDALWAAMFVAWAGAFAPRARPAVRAASAFGLCVAVELSQLYHAPVLDAVRQTRWGPLVLGSGFDSRDFAAYAAGVAIAFGLDAAFLRRSAAGPARDVSRR